MSRAYMQMRLAAFVSGLCGLLALPPGGGCGSCRPRVPAMCRRAVLASGSYWPAAAPRAAHMSESSRCSRSSVCRSTALRAPAWARWSGPVTRRACRRPSSRSSSTGIDWRSVVGGVGRRSLQPIEQKRLETVAAARVSWDSKRARSSHPAGLTNTSAIDDVLRSYVARARMEPDFDQLPIPYRAIATDMVTGEMVVLKSGDLATGDAREHGDTRGVRTGRRRQVHPRGRRNGPQHTRGHSPRDLCGRRHRREPRRASHSAGAAASRPPSCSCAAWT